MSDVHARVHRSRSTLNAMTEVYRADHPTQAHWVASILDGHGIAVEVHGERLFAMRGDLPLDPSTLPTVHVVDPNDAVRAREILREAFARAADPPAAPSWVCAGCGERQEGQFTSCWKCGVDAPTP